MILFCSHFFFPPHLLILVALADSMGGDTISTTGENALLDEIDELKDKLTAKEKTEADLKKQNQSLQDQVLCDFNFVNFSIYVLAISLTC